MTASAQNIGRSTRTLTIGSVAAQGMSALSQFLLVGWLTPDDFGLFASANAALIVLLALTNLGEVNAFLSGKVAERAELLTTTGRVNAALAAVGCAIAIVFYWLGNHDLALMTVLVALVIPLTGRSLAWNAVAIRAMHLRSAIGGQCAGAVTKLLAGVAIAAATQSAIALPMALGIGAVCNTAMTRWMLRRTSTAPNRPPVTAPVHSWFDRFRWGAQSMVQFFSAQVDYLVIAVIATPHILGIYFLAYQATVGISALVSGPLMKSGLVELGKSQGGDLATTRRLGLQTSGYVAILSGLGGAVVMSTSPYFPNAWSAAGAPLVLLLGSLTGRLLTPVLEAQLLASGQVGRSVWVNGADIMGTALAASVVVTGDVLLVALAVSCWKVTVTALRCVAVFGHRGFGMAAPAIVSVAAHAAISFALPQGSLLGSGALLASGLLVGVISRQAGRTAR